MKLADWSDTATVAGRLAKRGMSVTCSQAAAVCFVECAAALRAAVKSNSEVTACWAPGRIEVFGKHTDYCGGESILAAVERGFAMLAVPRDDNTIRLVNVRGHGECEFSLDTNIEPPLGHWSNYPQTVARRIARNFPNARRGATIAFVSNLPQASGMSSSSAFVVGTFLLLVHLNDLKHDPTYVAAIRNQDDLAGYLGSIENGGGFGPLGGDRGVGTFGGSEDHTAILRGRPDMLVHYGFCPVRHVRDIPLSDDLTFAIASSGVVAEKTGDALEKYNRVSKLASQIVDFWRRATGLEAIPLAAIVNDSTEASIRLSQMLQSHTLAPQESLQLSQRLKHFIAESQLIKAVPDRVDSATCAAFGGLANTSQKTGIENLQNQTPETIRLAELAEVLGAYGASAFGAGFGGSVWALVDQSNAAKFLADWRSRYLGEFPQYSSRSEFLLTRPGIAAFVA